MPRVPRIQVTAPARQSQHSSSSRRLLGRLGIALVLSAAALLGLATLGASARLRSSQSGDVADALASNPQASARERAPKMDFVAGEVLVRYRSNTEAGREELAATSLRRNGREIPVRVERFDGSNLIEGLRRARVSPEDTLDAIAALKSDPAVLYAEPNYILRREVVHDDARFADLWALKNTGQFGNVGPPENNKFVSGTPGVDIEAEEAWKTTTGSSSVVVGIVDSGIDINHPDLQANIWTNPGESGGGKESNGVDDDGNGRVDDVHGWDFYGNDNSVYDSPTIDDHGTHVAGTIGAVGNNSIGVAGINWQVKMMPLKFLGAPDGTGTTTGAIAAINYAVNMRNRGVNIRVLNNSWGGGSGSQSLTNAINSANTAGILFVAAAGNEELDIDDFPGAPSGVDAPNVIRVSASDRIDDLVYFSNYGRRLPSIGAPGRGILSTTPLNYPGATYTESDGSTYTFFSGTSMASPHVTGVAALIVAQYPSITMQRLRAALLYSGEPTPAMTGKTSTARRLNARLALENAATSDSTPPTVSGLGIAAQKGRAVTLQFVASDDGALAALYDVTFTSSVGGQYHLGAFAPSMLSNPQSLEVEIPHRQTGGTITLKVFDEVGNNVSANVSVTVGAAATEAYTVNLSPASALSTGGVPLSFDADDDYRIHYPLPFSFPFFGQTISRVSVSTNGALHFLSPPENDAGSSVRGINSQGMIAGLWDDLDLRTCFRADSDVYVVQPDANRIIFRWQGVPFSSSQCPAAPVATAINFEIELRSDGTIQTRYGAGNTGIKPVVGISKGEGDFYSVNATNAYVVSSHTSTSTTTNLTNAQTVTFAPLSATPVCTYAIGSTAQNFTASLGTSTVNVTAGTGCNWTATSNAPFIGISSGSSGTGNGTVSYTVAANPNATPRNGTLTIAGQTFTVTQDGAACSFSINPTVQPFVSAGGSTSVSLTATNGCPWTATSNASWLTITSPGNGTASSTITYTVAANSGQARTGTLTIAGQTLTVSQEAAPSSLPSIQFGLPGYSVSEGQGFVTINVTRSGDLSGPSTVKYTTTDMTGVNFNCDPATAGQGTGIASRKCDYHIGVGRLRFAAGEATRQLTLSVINDVYVEGPETFNLFLSNPSGATTAPNSMVTVTITDDDTPGTANPVDNTSFFVRQLYVDLLSREPDPAGWTGWTTRIDKCGQPGQPPPPCDRVTVAGDGFLRSGEFFDRQFFVIRLYRTGLGRILRYEDVGDLAYVSGFLTATDLELNKQDLVNEFVARPEFANLYNPLSNAAFVATLLQTAGVTVPQGAIDDWVARLNANPGSRAQIFREISERQEVSAKYAHEAQVISAYYGFFTRNPDGAYLNYLQRLDSGEINLGDLANAFINAAEYRSRFGQ
jgi:subtilisin family serine protease